MGEGYRRRLLFGNCLIHDPPPPGIKIKLSSVESMMELREVLAYRWGLKPWEWMMSFWERFLRQVPRI